ncbi:MAG: glycosyltransferase family protein [Betaproteobacteria bacterium]|jgi:glycosyltransferase involved in cell wall biosynthesis|nr:glycosyltransferase family protein [Betaproteobacteria bacterium]
MNTPSFSIIICSIDALKFTQASACYERLLAGFPHEIIGIHDARSLAEGYNRALRRARGDIVIFSHDDILILDPDFGQKISLRLQNFDILGFAGTRRVIAENWWHAGLPWSSGVIAHKNTPLYLSIWNPEPWPLVDGIQGIDGLCIMTRREVAEEIGFDEITFDGFHLYDLDFSFSAWRAGKKIGVCCDIPIIHASMGSNNKEHARYGRLFIEKHKDALPADAQKIDKITGIAASFPNHHALCAMWQEDFIRRSWIAFQRRGNGLDVAA